MNEQLCRCGHDRKFHHDGTGIWGKGCNQPVAMEMRCPCTSFRPRRTRASGEFQRRAEKFVFERTNAWLEFLDISAEAGYAIEDSLANRSLFMSGYESGKERMAQRTADLSKRVEELDQMLFGAKVLRGEGWVIRLEDYSKPGYYAYHDFWEGGSIGPFDAVREAYREMIAKFSANELAQTEAKEAQQDDE